MMDHYMERRLLSVHSPESRVAHKLVTVLGSLSVIVTLPLLHLGVFYKIWAPDKPHVDRAKCSCDCFDTVFRGRYEWPPSSYKHLYFNSTRNSLFIWLVLVTGVLCLYESLRYLIPLLLVHGRCVRRQMLALLISALYPHYYGWWALINYLNEDFFYYWYHQIFFSVTEVISTAVVLHLCNPDNKPEPWKLLIVFNINVIHVIVGGLDQFLLNVLFHQGQHFEAVRDFGLMIPDLFHVLVMFFEMQIVAQKKKRSLLRIFYREELMMSVVVIILFSLLGKNL